MQDQAFPASSSSCLIGLQCGAHPTIPRILAQNKSHLWLPPGQRGPPPRPDLASSNFASISFIPNRTLCMLATTAESERLNLFCCGRYGGEYSKPLFNLFFLYFSRGAACLRALCLFFFFAVPHPIGTPLPGAGEQQFPKVPRSSKEFEQENGHTSEESS